jgi:hypothetical protein
MREEAPVVQIFMTTPGVPKSDDDQLSRQWAYRCSKCGDGVPRNSLIDAIVAAYRHEHLHAGRVPSCVKYY